MMSTPKSIGRDGETSEATARPIALRAPEVLALLSEGTATIRRPVRWGQPLT